MKRSAKLPALALACLLLLSVLCIFSIPQLRTSLFVTLYHRQIEESLAAGHGVPADDAVFLGYRAVNSWDSTHPMTEFILLSYGDTYYGCYYSPDDVPLAFQNTAVPLTQSSDNQWHWQAEGDNWGSTSQIRQCWYFFRASF